jgi:hypothetical protein
MRWVADDEPTSPGAEQNPEGTSDGWRIFKLPRIAFVSRSLSADRLNAFGFMERREPRFFKQASLNMFI